MCFSSFEIVLPPIKRAFYERQYQRENRGDATDENKSRGTRPWMVYQTRIFRGVG